MILIAVSVVRSASVEVLAQLDDAKLELLDDLLLLVLRSSPSEPVQELVPRRSAPWPSTSTSLIAPSLASLSTSAAALGAATATPAPEEISLPWATVLPQTLAVCDSSAPASRACATPIRSACCT